MEVPHNRVWNEESDAVNALFISGGGANPIWGGR